VGAELFRAEGRMDGQTNMTKQTGKFGAVVDINTSDGIQQVASPNFLSEDRMISSCRNVLCLQHKFMDKFQKPGNPRRNVPS